MFIRFLLAALMTGAVQFSVAQTLKDFSDRILKFHSDILVQANGKILVTESITVYNGDGENTPGFDRYSFAFNNDIKKGILREFPTSYEDTSGFWATTGFKIKGIYKNGNPEPYTTESLSNGTRVRIGNKDIDLAPGEYNYRIQYETERQLIFHSDKDELYWNVNGNGWAFTADTVSCMVQFPQAAVIKEYACYTGPQGSTATLCTGNQTDSNIVYFTTTEKLNSYDGLTIAVAVNKGVLVPPTSFSKLSAFLRANYIIPLLSFFLLVLIVYYFLTWYKKGRDPGRGIVYPQFSPPEGLTPADVGYIIEQEYGSHLFAAALVDCAVKKQLVIDVTREGLIIKSNVYNFNRPESDRAEPGVSDKKITNISQTKDVYGFSLETLYGQKAQKGKYNSTLRSCYLALHNTLKERFLIQRGKKNKWYGLFALNKGYVTIGFIMLIVAIFLGFQFMVVHPSFKLLTITAIFLVAMLMVQMIFSRIMSAYSVKGRDVADHLLGFKMYLQQAEQRVYNELAPPEKTLDLFEKYLPYAIAMKVENDWAAKFDNIMQKALADGYRPAYYSMYHGSMSNFTMRDMSRGISSGLSNTVSSASTPPSSSRGGSSGGGSSGGGGGGGGGGGW